MPHLPHCQLVAIVATTEYFMRVKLGGLFKPQVFFPALVTDASK